MNTQNLCSEAERQKIIHTPANPTFSCIKGKVVGRRVSGDVGDGVCVWVTVVLLKY